MEVVYDQKKITTSQFNYCSASSLLSFTFINASSALISLITLNDCTHENVPLPPRLLEVGVDVDDAQLLQKFFSQITF